MKKQVPNSNRKILALETSARAVSAAVSDGGKILASGYQDTGLTHSRTLMPIVEHILKNSDLCMGDMDAVAVAVGPGSFTGIRIGVASAQGLAFGAEIPCIAVSTLAAMARSVAFLDGLIVCAIDARRQQVYNALFSAKDGAITRLTEDRAISLHDLAVELSDPESVTAKSAKEADMSGIAGRITVVGDGAELCSAFLLEHGIPCRAAPPHLIMQNAAGVALEAEILAAAGNTIPARELRPFYLRPPQALTLKQRQETK